jgi:hypothetical protein
MPKLTNNFLESQKFFIQNTVIPLIEANRKLPREIRKTDSRMIEEIAFRFGKSSKQIIRLLSREQGNATKKAKIIQQEQLDIFYPS